MSMIMFCQAFQQKQIIENLFHNDFIRNDSLPSCRDTVLLKGNYRYASLTIPPVTPPILLCSTPHRLYSAAFALSCAPKCRLIRFMKVNSTRPTMYVHPTSVVDEGAHIGEGTRIWHFCHIMGSAVIGTDCVLGQNVFIGADVRIGRKVKIQNNVSLYTGVEVEDQVFLGPSCVLTNVINPRAAVERKSEFLKTLIKKGATVGANATILCGVTLGRWCFIGAGAVVTHDVPDYGLFMGNPARLSGWMSRGGHRLRFDDQGIATCPVTGEQYALDADAVLCLTPQTEDDDAG